MDNAEVYTISCKNLAVAVSKTPLTVYEPDRENSFRHEQVIRAVMEHETIIPICFGVIFKSEEDIRYLVESTYTELEEIYYSVKGKIEVGLLIFWKKDSFTSEVLEGSREIKNLKKEIAAGKDLNYYEKMYYGEVIQKIADKRRDYYRDEVISVLKNHAVSYKLNDIVGEKMILNAAFLVDKEKEELFDLKVNEVYEKWKNNLVFKYTGPWPPYNFVTVKLRIE